MSTFTALVTGCSTGIGRALALDLHGRGIQVYATARRLDAIEDLAQRGLHIAALDVDSAQSIAALVKYLDKKNASIDLLINNAGYGAMGPLAEMPLDALKRQFATNVFSLMAVTQALLPSMIARRSGCIVNIGSVSGVTATPFSGAYCASKAAVHALSDALRMELKPFGVRVVTAQPGGICSNFGENASTILGDTPSNEASLYAPLQKAINARAGASQYGAMPAEEFSRYLVNAVLSSSQPSIVRAGKHSRLLPALSRWLSTNRLDALLSKRFGLDQLRG